MPKFNVYLLTPSVVWDEVEAANSEEAYVDVMSSDLDKVLNNMEKPYRIVVEEIDPDDEDVLEADDVYEEEKPRQIEPGHTVRHEKGYEVHKVTIEDLEYNEDLEKDAV